MSFWTDILNGQFMTDMIYTCKLVDLLAKEGFIERKIDRNDGEFHSPSLTFARSDMDGYCSENLEFYTFTFRRTGIEVLHKNVFYGDQICERQTSGEDGTPYDFWYSFTEYLNFRDEF